MLRLEECYSLPKERIGGKALHLAKMHASGVRVKPAVVLEVDEVNLVLAKDHVHDDILAVVSSGLRNTKGLAVRSSAVDEDGRANSWAGQFQSQLYVESAMLPAAILECASAKTSDRVRSYMKVSDASAPDLALVIQEMVDAEISGVLFTVNPVHPFSGEMVIEAVEGVSEDFVSGKVQPRRYFVDSAGKVLREEGSDSPQLTEAQVKDLYETAGVLRNIFDGEQDIEWAIEKGTGALFINQSRGITSLYDEDASATPESIADDLADDLRLESRRLEEMGFASQPDVLSDQNIAELLTPHPSQMALSLFTYCFAHGHGAIRTARNEMGYDIGDELATGFFRLVAGQPRCSIVHDALTYRIKGIPLGDYAKLVDRYLAEIADKPELANYPEVVLYRQNPSLDFLREVFADRAEEYADAYDSFFRNIREIEDSLAAECSDLFLPSWKARMESFQLEHPADLAGLTAKFGRVADALRTDACRMFVKVARLGFFVYARLRQMLAPIYQDRAEGILAGLTGGIPVEMNPNLQFSADLYSHKKGETSFDTVVERYGHLASHELEISHPRYHEQPKLLADLAERISNPPMDDFLSSQERSNRLQAEVLAAAGDDASALAREIMVARTYLPLREVVKFNYLRAYDILRRTAMLIGQKLGWEEDLVFNLTVEEVVGLSGNEDAFRALAEKRRDDRLAFRAFSVPTVLAADRLQEISYLQSNDHTKVLRGIGVTNVVVEGEVVLAKSMEDIAEANVLKEGSILVTVTTDPAWSPVISIIGSKGGLVTEVGGLLAHGAIYAREVHMAAVLNVPNVTDILRTGMRVRVNGALGTVEILD